MKVIKVVAGDAGSYRCEVTAKDKCDSSTFEISVEGEWVGKNTTVPPGHRPPGFHARRRHDGDPNVLLSLVTAAQQGEQTDILSAFKRA